MTAKVDVLICAYNEAANIAQTLESLRAQTASPKSFRVIVVDNASQDDTRRVVEENAHGLELEYVYEAQPGLNSARNTGYRHARAAYVAHLDADAKADSRWIETITQAIRQERPIVCGGPLFPYYLETKPEWYLDRYNTDYRGDVACYLPEQMLNGSNMVWQRSIVEQLGGFDVDIGLKGRGLTRGDETSLIVRARKTFPDFAPFYHPGIVVHHLVRPDTFSLWYWTRRFFLQGSHDHKVWDKDSVRRPLWFWPAKFLAVAAAASAQALRATIRRDKTEFPYWKSYCFEKLLPEVYRLGMLWELVHRQKNATQLSGDA